MKITGTRSTIVFNMEDGHIMYAKGELLLNKSFVVDKKLCCHGNNHMKTKP